MKAPLIKRTAPLKLHARRARVPNGAEKHFSASRVMSDIESIVAHTRWMTSPEILRAARYIKTQLSKIDGLVDVQLLEFPSDGRTAYGGWVMPKSWDVSSATLRTVSANGRNELVLADYRKNPFSLMMWSPPTPRQGLEAPVAIVTEPLKNGRALKGKFALMNLDQVAQPRLQWAAECGAVGVISDTMITRKGIKEGRYLDDAVQYWNYTNPQWDGAPRLPAFGLTPKLGRRLRALLAENPNLLLRAKVNARLYDGTLPLVTARLPGRGRGEFVLTAHMDEPGASDNASGTALAMETLRCIAEHVGKTGQRPAAGIRFFASVEARGLQAYLNTRRVGKLGITGGLNLDMLGYDHTAGRTMLELVNAQPATPSALGAYMEAACQREAQRSPRFQFKSLRSVAVDDCHFAGAPFNAPMICVEQAPDKTYHCSLDTPENLSRTHLQRMGRLVLDTIRFFTSGDTQTIEAFALSAYSGYAARMKNEPSSAQEILRTSRTVFAQLLDLLPEEMPIPTARDVAAMRERGQLKDGYLNSRHVFAERITGWNAELKALAAAAPAQSPAPAAPLPEALARTARALVPAKQFFGYLAFEDLSKAERAKLKKACGIDIGWGAPSWLQWALDLASGKRTLLEIYTMIAAERKLDLRNLIGAMRFLRAREQVKFRPVLTAADLRAAIAKTGVHAGDIVMVHTALSDFGYFDGGADAIIDCLLDLAGPAGTVCVPTHSLNWIGRPPYDPKTSPSYTGAVPAAFLRRAGVQRSLHPTHSVAAIGPRATELLAGHDHTVAPQAREGFWGKFVDAGGKVLMLCRLQSNTLLHGGELWGGIPYPPTVVHYLQDGKRNEVDMAGMPWHVHSFDLVHEELRARGRLKTVPLGESRIHAMDAREATDAMVRLVTRDPFVAVKQDCKCAYCAYLRINLKGRAPRTDGSLPART